jgi:hypothetical protein
MKVTLLWAAPILPQSQQTLEQELHSKDPQMITIPALKRIANTRDLYKNPQVQVSVIQLFNSETMNPEWEHLAEMRGYEDS